VGAPTHRWAVDNFLVYVTGGLAVGQVKADFVFTDTFATALETASISQTKAGWTVGVGGEVGLAAGWSLKAEYLYVHLGTVTANSTNLDRVRPAHCIPGNVFTHSVEWKANIVRIGLNYRFGGPVVARY
jgi:outer membrane immunogenic protein